MAAMTAKRRDEARINWRADWWLWPTALLLILGGWGEALWMWENTPPQEGLAPLWLLLWTGTGIAGTTMPIYWLARRWQPVAWMVTAAWAAVPPVNDLAGHYNQVVRTEREWLYSLAPLLLLLLLGVGLSGAMMTVSWFAGRRWPGPRPDIRPLREGFWCGLFAVTCGWLLINRTFSLVSVVLLASALLLIETSFIVRESSDSSQ